MFSVILKKEDIIDFSKNIPQKRLFFFLIRPFKTILFSFSLH